MNMNIVNINIGVDIKKLTDTSTAQRQQQPRLQPRHQHHIIDGGRRRVDDRDVDRVRGPSHTYTDL